MAARLAQLHRFPVKGLQHEPMHTAVLAPAQGLPGDRRFAVARGDTRWTAESPRWLPKQWFVMLMRDTALTRVHARVDDGTITLAMDGRDECRASWATPDGRARLDDWLNDVLGPRPEGRARLVEAGETSLTDVPQNCLSLLNLESVRDLGRRMGGEIDPLRFRANLLVDGLPPWCEFDWIGREVRLGGVTLSIPTRIPRCTATAVNPATGARDVNVVRGLRAAFGHYDMGVYAEVVRGGTITVGDELTPPDAPQSRSWAGHWLRFFGFVARGAPDVFRRG
jgi:uncharacterized protein YcbX